MGNKVTQSSISATFAGDFEHRSAKKLIAAIKANDPAAAQKAIDQARAEFSKPVSSNVNKAEFDDMIDDMKKYLTRQYDIGDGPLYTRSPADYAKFLKSNAVLEVINKNMMELEGLIPGSGPKFSATVGEVTHDRAAVAKARLQAFRDKK